MVWKQFAFFAQSLDMQPMGVSARDMSLSLGQSESYINKIENKRTLPSMTGFFYICDYLNITPQEFFNTDAAAPQKSKERSARSSGCRRSRRSMFCLWCGIS